MNQVKSWDSSKVTLIASGDGEASFERTTADEKIIEGNGNSLSGGFGVDRSYQLGCLGCDRIDG